MKELIYKIVDLSDCNPGGTLKQLVKHGAVDECLLGDPDALGKLDVGYFDPEDFESTKLDVQEVAEEYVAQWCEGCEDGDEFYLLVVSPDGSRSGVIVSVTFPAPKISSTLSCGSVKNLSEEIELSITPRQREILEHTLGAKSSAPGYRNHYVVSPSHEPDRVCVSLVQLGAMELVGQPDETSQYNRYRATQKGMDLVGVEKELD